MENSPNVSKCGKDLVQSDYLIPGEARLADSLGNTEPNANWAVEPNFNLNHNLASPRTPRQTTETSKLHGGNKNNDGTKGGGKPGAKGAVTMEAVKSTSTLATPMMSPGEKDDPFWQKSKIPALSRSPTPEASLNNRGEQRLKSPNPKRIPTLSPKTHTNSNMAASPKPQPTTSASSPRTAEREKTQVPRAESANASNPKPHTALTTELTTKTTNKSLKTNRKDDGGKGISQETQSPKTFHPPVSPRVQNQKGDSKLANRTPSMTAKTQQPDPASTKPNEKTGHDSRTHSSETPPIGPKLLNQRAEMALLSTKTPQPSSLSPKPSTQRKASGTRNSNASGSKENLDSKDSSIGSGSKTSSKSSSNSKATTATKDSLDLKTGTDSKASPKSETAMGSMDSLDSKSGSVSKTSWGSKDSLDFKTGSNSKASSNCKSGMGSRDSLGSKTATEIKASKTSSDLKTVVGSKSGMGSEDDLDPKSQTLDSKGSFNLKTSPCFKPSFELNLHSNSDVLPSSKPGPTRSTSKPSLTASGPKIGLVGSVSPLSSRIGLSGSKDNNLKTTISSAKPSPDPKASGSSKLGPVLVSSKSALADLSSSIALSPRPSSAKRSPGSGPGKSLGSLGPNKEVQRSPGSTRGNYIHSLISGCNDPELLSDDSQLIMMISSQKGNKFNKIISTQGPLSAAFHGLHQWIEFAWSSSRH